MNTIYWVLRLLYIEEVYMYTYRDFLGISKLFAQTNVGPILISVNPYADNKNPLTLTSMRSVSLDAKLLKVVEDAVRQQSETGYPQAIILSG